MLSIGTSIAPSQNKLNYFLFFKEAGNILPLKKQYPASPGTRVLLAFRGYSCSLNDTCPRVPCMAGGLAERSEGWNAEGEGMPPLLNHFNDQRRRHPSETNMDAS
jgi:hypothetical protein